MPVTGNTEGHKISQPEINLFVTCAAHALTLAMVHLASREATANANFIIPHQRLLSNEPPSSFVAHHHMTIFGRRSREHFYPNRGTTFAVLPS
jgi:hypothetical protein